MQLTESIKKINKRLLYFCKHHINESTFKMKWKLDGAIYVKYRSLKAQNKKEALQDSIAKAIVSLVKILKERSRGINFLKYSLNFYSKKSSNTN